MSRKPDTLFEDLSLNGDEALLLDDLGTLVMLGLVEERPSPDGPMYELTEFGRTVNF